MEQTTDLLGCSKEVNSPVKLVVLYKEVGTSLQQLRVCPFIKVLRDHL